MPTQNVLRPDRAKTLDDIHPTVRKAKPESEPEDAVVEEEEVEDEGEGDDEDVDDEEEVEDGPEDDEEGEEDEDDDEAAEDESAPEQTAEPDPESAHGSEIAPVVAAAPTVAPAPSPTVAAPAAPAAAPAPSVTPGGAPIPPPYASEKAMAAAEAIVKDAQDAMLAQGKDPETVRKFATYTKRFLAIQIDKGVNLATMSVNTLNDYVRSGWKNPGTQNVYLNTINSMLKAARERGHVIAEQNAPLNKVERKRKTMDPTHGNGAVAPGYPQLPAFGSPAVVMPPEFGGAAVQAPQVVAAAPAAAAPAPRRAPAPRALTVDGLPVGGKVIIYKQALGNEMPGIAPGQLITIGSYPPAVIAAEGSVADFIQKWVTQKYGPVPGGPDVIYVVDRVDDRGNRMRAPEQFPFAAPVGPPTNMGHQNPVVPGMPGPVAAPANPNDRVVENLNKQLDLMMDRYDKLQAKLDAGRGNGQDAMQAVAFMAAQREADDLKRQIEDLKREREERRFRPDPAPVPPNAAGFGGGLAGLFGPEPTPPPAPREDKLAETLGKVVEMALAVRNVPPAPAPTAPQRDPIMDKMFEMFMAFMMKDKGPDPTMIALMQEVKDLRMMTTKTPDKSRDFAETLGNIKEAMSLVNMLNGGNSERPSTVVELAEILAPHLDKVGAALGSVLGAFAGKAPQLPAPTQPQPVTPPAPAAKPKPKVLPPEAKKLLSDMAAAQDSHEGDQQIVNNLFSLVAVFNSKPDFQPLAQAVAKGYVNCNSRPEIRSLVTSIFKACGEKALAQNEDAIERVTLALWRNYSFLYQTLTGGQTKTLIDAEPQQAQPTQPEPEPAQPVEPEAAQPESTKPEESEEPEGTEESEDDNAEAEQEVANG